jgi:hypothetical protein
MLRGFDIASIADVDHRRTVARMIGSIRRCNA